MYVRSCHWAGAAEVVPAGLDRDSDAVRPTRSVASWAPWLPALPPVDMPRPIMNRAHVGRCANPGDTAESSPSALTRYIAACLIVTKMPPTERLALDDL